MPASNLAIFSGFQILAGLALATTLLPAAPAQDTTSTAPGSIDWRTDLDAARAEALRDGKPLLAVFRCEP